MRCRVRGNYCFQGDSIKQLYEKLIGVEDSGTAMCSNVGGNDIHRRRRENTIR